MTTPVARQRPSFVLTLGLLTAVAAVTIDMSLPAIPAMVEALVTTLPLGQKIVGIFMAGMACGQIPAGLISDRVGRRPVLFAGLAIFTVTAAVAATATDVRILLAARFVQGFGAAAPIVLARAIVRDVAHGRDAARLMSVMTMIFTTAPVIAPTIGALLVAQLGWRSPFVVIALLGILIMAMVARNVAETHRPVANAHPVRQLQHSTAMFFAHRQSVFGLLLNVLLPVGYMSMIAVSAAMTVEIYGYSVTAFGFIFALAGFSVLAGAVLNRWLVARFDSIQVIAVGASLLALSGGQLLVIAWLDAAAFAWLWASICLFMLTIPMTMSNATVIALDPLPKISGVASSIIGTLQNLCGAAGALVAAAIYDGSVRRSVSLMAGAALLAALVFLLRRVILPGGVTHQPQEPARD